LPIEAGNNVPWLDNWPLDFQLWDFADSREPGDELNLTPSTMVVGLETRQRAVTARWRALTGTILFSSVEGTVGSLVSITQAQRGLVRVVPQTALWNVLDPTGQYTLEIVAYGVVYHTEPFNVGVPPAGDRCLNGMLLYAAPREILEVLGQVPGASIEIAVPLTLSWEQDIRGYWFAEFPADQVLYGFWLDDNFVPEVAYANLALKYTRAIARVGDTIYYNGPEDISKLYVETAFSRYVLRCIEEATAEAERRTGRRFGLWRYQREAYNGLRQQRQVHLRQRPFVLDPFFRLDALSYSRALFRRYTETDFAPVNSYNSGAQVLHGDAETGTITINQNAWDVWDWGYAAGADLGVGTFATLPPGRNNIEITYTAGHSQKIPTDIAEAVANMAGIRQAIFWQQALTQGLSGLSIGCVNLNFGEMFARYTPAWQLSANAILDSYTRLDLDFI
jgi:hypothetical protein